MKKIWSSLPLDLLRKEILDAGISKDDFLLFDKPEDITRAEILFGSLPKDRSFEAQLSKMAVRWIQLESVDCSYLTLGDKKNIIVTNMRGVFSRMIAESVIGSLLAFYRGLWVCRDAHQNKQWHRWPIRNSLENLTAKSVVILGGGMICREIVKLLAPFECRIVVYRQKNEPIEYALTINKRDHLLDEIARADIVINALPATDKTKGICSKEFFDRFSCKTVFVNVGRGTTVEEDALIWKLKNNELDAAILDVTEEEPLAKNSNLWDAPNLYLTQHTAGGHKDELSLKCRFFTQNFQRYLKRQSLLNQAVL